MKIRASFVHALIPAGSARMRLKSRLRSVAVLLVASLVLTCRIQPWQGFPTAIDSNLVFPPPPEKPRIAYVMQITQQQDLFKTGGIWNSFKEALGGAPDSRIVRPFALALHADGGLLVADPGKRIVHFFNWEHREYVEIGAKLEGGLQSPVGVAALPDGRILVCDSRLGAVESFDAKGRALGQFCDSGVVERPAGIAVNGSRGEVYVTDVTRHCVAVLNFSGHLLRTIGKRGNGQGEFNFPTHLTLGPDGRLYVTDSMNFRVQVLEPDGTFVRSIGRLGDAPGQFSKPKGVAVDSEGHVIVVEGLYDALEFFSGQGELLLSVGTSGSKPGEFWLPSGLLLDREKHLLFVADSYNSRVQVFRLLEESKP